MGRREGGREGGGGKREGGIPGVGREERRKHQRERRKEGGINTQMEGQIDNQRGVRGTDTDGEISRPRGNTARKPQPEGKLDGKKETTVDMKRDGRADN